jgi:hypothetical protein
MRLICQARGLKLSVFESGDLLQASRLNPTFEYRTNHGELGSMWVPEDLRKLHAIQISYGIVEAKKNIH